MGTGAALVVSTVLLFGLVSASADENGFYGESGHAYGTQQTLELADSP